MTDETDPPRASPAPPSAPASRTSPADIDENATLGELLRREGPGSGALPPALANMTAQEAKARLQGGARGVAYLILAWLVFGAVGGMASLAIDALVVHHPSGLAGAELWKAQALLAAPYILLAFVGGRILRRVQDLPKPQAWALAISMIFGLMRLARFHWCGPADATADAGMARFADAAVVFSMTRLGFGSAGAARVPTPSPDGEDRFGPGPIEP